MARKKKSVKIESGGSATQMHQLLDQFKDDHYNFKEDIYYKVSTGSLILDIRIGGGIMPGLHRFCGINEGGKTSEALEVMKNALSTVENAKGFYVKSEGRLDPEMEERSGIKFVKNPDNFLNSNEYSAKLFFYGNNTKNPKNNSLKFYPIFSYEYFINEDQEYDLFRFGLSILFNDIGIEPSFSYISKDVTDISIKLYLWEFSSY